MGSYAVVGGTLWGNRGAEAMVVATIGRVREHDAKATFLLMSYMHEADRALVQDPDVEVVAAGPERLALLHVPFAAICWLLGSVGLRLPDVLLPRPIAQLRRCRALFDVSGISFHDGRLPVVAYNIVCVWPALLLGVPVVRLSQAMGPFRHPLNRLPARWVAAASLHTFARGRHSADHLRGLRVPDGRWSVAPDVAFAYVPSDSLTSENRDRVEQVSARLAGVRAAGTRVVAVVPSSLVLTKIDADGGDYLGLLDNLVTELQDRGYHVLVLPNATRASSTATRNNDLVCVRGLQAWASGAMTGVDASRVTYVDFDLNTASIRRLLEPCELVVTSRFHAMVAALALGVPPLVLGWSHKYEEVLEMFDCAEYAVDVAATEGELLALLDRALADIEATRARIRSRLEGVCADARRQFDVIEQLPAR